MIAIVGDGHLHLVLGPGVFYTDGICNASEFWEQWYMKHLLGISENFIVPNVDRY